MKKFILFFSLLFCLCADIMAQPATYALPFSIGRNNCGSTSGSILRYSFPGVSGRSYDSTYFFDYVSPNLSRSILRNAYVPRLRIGSGTYNSSSPAIVARDRFAISAASVSFNPRDGKLYYLWTDYSAAISPTLKTYVWRWNPDTTFSTVSYTNPAVGLLLDTLASFAFDIGGITFDNSGNAWQLEFSNAPAPYKSRMRKIDFVAKIIDPIPDTLDLIPTVGIGSTIYNVSSGDITLMPNGQMYYVFDNKLYTPDYGSYGNPTHHIYSTYIDTIRRPTGATSLVGLAFGNGDLISSFSPGCIYRRIDPITGDTNNVIYTYAAAKGVQSTDMSQISSGLGLAKRLVSITSTGTAGQYNVVYDVLIKNYGTTGLTNIQVYDSLSMINGAANLSNVTTTMLTIPPPPGIALNAAFNGITDARLLQFTGQNLPNYPVDSSSFTVRINCRISNVLAGVVYNNSAIGIATGYKGVALRDSSTNGNAPDLNQNDKPDDVGEGQPTPFVIILTPTTPPCGTLSQILYTNTFGTGVGLSASLPASPSMSTQYTGTATAPVGTNRFSTTNNAALGDPTNWISLTDHTGDANGRMMVVNADAPPSVFYRDTLPVACPGQQYSMSFWTAFIGNSTYQAVCNALGGFKYPRFLVRMRDLTTGLTITQFTTASITSNSWQQLGMKWVMPPGYTNIIMELLNAGPGGCGNDFALDDVQYGICDPVPSVSASSSCFGGTATFTSALNDTTVIPGSKAYQWQVAPALAGPYVNIIGATSSTYIINPILAADTGKYYRVIVAAAGNIAIAACQYTSPGVKLTSAISSVAPSSISAPSTTFCNPGSATLTAVGGTLGTSANYQWGTGAVVGTSPIAGATSSSLIVSPTVTTTYWVRIENTAGPCTSTTGGTTVTITVMQPSSAPANITGPDVCNGSSTTLTANGGTLGTGANYQWGTGAVVGTSPIGGATASTLTVSPVVSTTYWVQIQNTTAPCTATTGGVTKLVTVNQPSVAPSSITSPATTICNGSSATLTANGGTLGTGANYQWGTGAVVGTSPIGGATASTLVVSPTVTTTYWVRVENTTSPCTATTGGVTVTITVNQPSTAPANITGPDICNGSSTTLTANGGTLGTGANYQWGTGAVVGTSPIGGATASTLIVSPIVSTTYWVRIQNTSAPCTAITGGVTKMVTVTQPSVAPSSITAPATTICNGSSATLTANGGTLGTGANYQWGTGAVVGTSPIGGATASTLVVSPTVTTTYWVRVENTTSPCTATTGGVTVTITVNQPSTAPANITGPDICNGSSTTLTANGGTLGTGANYQWGTGAVVGTSPIGGATASTLTVSPIVSTTYWVRIQNTSAPCTAITGGVTKLVTVNQPSTAPTSVTGPDICNGSSATLTASGGTLGTGANYQWGTGAVVGVNPIGGATSSTLTVSPAVTTTYWVRIENTTAPCTATTGGLTKVITVSQLSVAAASATTNKNNTCPGISVSLGITGGTLGTGATWRWYTSACGTTLVGTGVTISVTPSVTTTYYVRAEGTCNTTACQPVTITINCDVDKDDDGIPDFVESNMAAAFLDVPANGIINAYDPLTAGFVDYNNDFVNDNYQADGDINNNTIPNYLDPAFPGRVDINADGIDDRFDIDLDGILNMLDLDSDNDGVPDVVEEYGVDTNGNGKIDNMVDADGDGLSDNVDSRIIPADGAYNTGTGLGLPNLDGDVAPNFLDLDSDNDGIPDIVEVGAPDVNNNGKVDGFLDANNDGLHDGYINGGALLITGTDGNADGRADSWPNKNLDRDLRPNAYDMDSDGDGIVDVIEAGLPDANLNGIVDGVIGANGWSTTVSAMPALNLRNTDGVGNFDFLDIDSDEDGIPDNIEGMTTAGYAFSTLVDADGDGLMNPYDNLPGAFGGSGIMVYDHDGDVIPDYRDIDADADGLGDRVEGNDYNLNGQPDDNVTPTGIDTDGDGLDNRYDSLNSVTNIKGTSYRMGNGGSFTGDATPGSRTTVQRTWPLQPDRDWRYVGFVLPVQFVKLAGLLQADKVTLNWIVIADKEVDHFEVERSTDNINFIKTGSVNQLVKLHEQQSFSFIDDVTNVKKDIIYYRIKVIGKAGEIQYSNIIVIRRQQNKTLVSVMPNPARDYVSIAFFSEKDSKVTIRLIDNLGKIILLQDHKVAKGNNTIQLNGLSKYSSAVYSLQLLVNEELITHKLILLK